MNRARRLGNDFEALVESSRVWFLLAVAFLVIRPIARDYAKAETHQRVSRVEASRLR